MAQVYDIDLLGTITPQGQIKELFDKEAIENSIVVWLTSYNTDVIRSPGKGGYLVYFLSKQMSDSVADDIRDSIIDGLNQDFNIYVQLKSLTVAPDYEQKIWQIDLEAYVPDIQDFVSVSASIKNLV
jgi:hypothetical protein